MLVPLRSEGRVLGSLLVAEPLGDAVAYKPEDLRQLQALANHAAVAIDNAVRADLILRQAAEREHAALHDELTGLPNRRLFTQRVDEALGRGFASVLLVDLDSFRAVNDTLGHQVGDRLLEMIAQRITDSAPEDAVVSRLGGDEFAVLLPDAGDLSARACASMVRSAIAHTFDLDGLSVAVDAAVGVVVAEQGADAATVLRHADLALYAAQESRSGTAVFEPSLDRNDSSRLGLLAALRHAVAGNQVEVHYQPQIDLPSGKVTGVEALARWRHPELGPIAPDEFVPLAEHSGLITPLTMLVLRTALRDVEQLQQRPGDFRVAVNISPRSLLDPGFVDEVARELARVALPASVVTLEITETSLMTDPEQAVDALTRLRSIGVRLSVDDLGTGYSSLAYLLKLPVDELKIDRSLVSTLPDEPAEVVVGAIADLGHRLGRHVVAEGIEDAVTYDVVRRLGCDLAQGYWMGRPMPVEDLRTYLAERRNTRRGGLRQVL
jgi:diguanylate cyclase (GGDEF)-like protein